MAMTQLIQKLGPLLLESAAAVSYLRKRMGESRPNGAEARLAALENAIEVQSTFNKTVDVQMNLIVALLEKAQRLQLAIVALIATGTLAARPGCRLDEIEPSFISPFSFPRNRRLYLIFPALSPNQLACRYCALKMYP